MSDITGGMRWHVRAMMGRLFLWRPFLQDISAWLATWQPQSDKLLIIGSSAGWSLPDEFLSRFREIHCIDLDESAAVLFKLLHHRVKDRVKFSRRDFFAQPGKSLADFPDHAVLLCNIAGQRCFQLKNVYATLADLSALQARLQYREWASYHDLLSTSASHELRTMDLEGRLQAQDIIKAYALAGEWHDHLTGALLPMHWPRKIIPWRLSGGRLHLIEAGYSPISPPS